MKKLKGLDSFLLSAFIGAVVVLVSAASFAFYENRDKFKVGDIVEVVYETEFSKHIHHEVIVEVGKRRYLTVSTDVDGNAYNYNNEVYKFDLNRYELKEMK